MVKIINKSKTPLGLELDQVTPQAFSLFPNFEFAFNLMNGVETFTSRKK